MQTGYWLGGGPSFLFASLRYYKLNKQQRYNKHAECTCIKTSCPVQVSGNAKRGWYLAQKFLEKTKSVQLHVVQTNQPCVLPFRPFLFSCMAPHNSTKLGLGPGYSLVASRNAWIAFHMSSVTQAGQCQWLPQSHLLALLLALFLLLGLWLALFLWLGLWLALFLQLGLWLARFFLLLALWLALFLWLGLWLPLLLVACTLACTFSCGLGLWLALFFVAWTLACTVACTWNYGLQLFDPLWIVLLINFKVLCLSSIFFIKEASHETFVLEALFYEIWRKPRMKRSFWKLVLLNFEEASHETIILETFSVKIVGSIVRNDRFGSLFSENWRKPRTKRSFWKLFLWKLPEASCETLVLEACSVKFRGSIARNDRFGSFFCENCRKPRAKRSFWKLVLWNFEEASRETLVLEACSVKFRGSLARNDRFRLWNLVLVAAFSY